MSATRVFVVASSPATRTGLRKMLAEAGADGGPDVEVAGEAGSPEDPAVASSGADVVLVADEDSLEEAARAVAGDGALVLLADDEGPIPSLAGSALKGWGVVPPDAPPRELSAAIAAAGRGLVVLPGPLADRLLVDGLVVPEAETLTAREAEVLELLSRGLPNKQIARELGISEHTVKYHVTSVFGKLGASSRAEAVGLGARLGLIKL